MAERKNPFGPTFEEIDRESIRKYNERIKAMGEREKLLERQYTWRGNKLPPMNIEPFATDRLRMDGMTDADRALRRQWLADQKLAPNEPRFVPELFPRNPIRRIYAAPWNALFNALKPMLGPKMSASGRYWVPRLTFAAVLSWAAYYNLIYCPRDWDHRHGFHMYRNRPKILPGDAEWPNAPVKSGADFADCGFSKREAFKEL
ncbi:hypothetical protein CAPTEDRAFT_225966 [Capitella teleta]|uniref:Uncharacterized protein n=1 Tax=Capitella teleta TaxID=283909 RepID=R7U4N9_CAPTE|nr:hypothetical protein CAPTEDRAFT_225966 [Capitella teleta]|eukprot:ELT98130.1 hypothetical protein CAPTEDRAFT_225966 [Capitella teleta]